MKKSAGVLVVIFLVSLIIAGLVKWISGSVFGEDPSTSATQTVTPSETTEPSSALPSVNTTFEASLKALEPTVTAFETEYFSVNTNESTSDRIARIRPFLEPSLLTQVVKSEVPKEQTGELSNADKAKQEQGFIRRVEKVTILSTEPIDETVTTVEAFIEVTTTDGKGNWPNRFTLPESHISHWSYNGEKWIVIGLPQLNIGAEADINDS